MLLGFKALYLSNKYCSFIKFLTEWLIHGKPYFRYFSEHQQSVKFFSTDGRDA